MNAGLTQDQEVFVKTAVGKDFAYNDVEAELIRLYGRIHERDHRSRDHKGDRATSQFGYRAGQDSRSSNHFGRDNRSSSNFNRYNSVRRQGGKQSCKGSWPKHTRHETSKHRAYMAEADSDDDSVNDPNEPSSESEGHYIEDASTPNDNSQDEYFDTEDKIGQ